MLRQRGKQVRLSVNEYGRGRAVYLSGLPYSFHNARLLHRSLLWAGHGEDLLHRWYSSNYYVDVHAYLDSGKYCVVNNTFEPQETVVYRGQGEGMPLSLTANEIRWFHVDE